ncbi:2-isopropylmalate synthase 2, chloroplastic-like protein [Corchorus olitorius]|uniref:2-isopropylmalate synthase 2, chloroplastic-like protein n=1 Tax=Corchorus olitorius TaxID=93759 RepID=A0A1R3JH89_9ROSI|nr:2-isopropylmalate synthase 2, chloroplastic-like protein [Corchorus olitorius]
MPLYSLETIKPTSEVLAAQEAKTYLAGANSLSYSPNYSPERVANSEFIQDLAQITLSHNLSPSIFLNDEEMVDLEELLASNQPDGVVADMWKDIDGVYLSNITRELNPDSSANPAACNANDPSWGAIITYPAPKCHNLTMPMGGIGGSDNGSLDEARLRYKIPTLKRYEEKRKEKTYTMRVEKVEGIYAATNIGG